MKERPFGEGYVAGEHGAPASFNPHEKDSQLYALWEGGWKEAQREYEIESTANRVAPVIVWFVTICILAVIGFTGYGVFNLFKMLVAL